MQYQYKDNTYNLYEIKVVGDKPRTMVFEIYASVETGDFKVAEYPTDLWFDILAIYGKVTDDIILDILKQDIIENMARNFGHEVPVNTFAAPKSMRVAKDTNGEHVVEYAY